MNDEPPVVYSVSDGVARVELNRPAAMNALTEPLAMALTEAVRAAEADDAVKVLLLTGRGRSFCAGGDVRMMTEAADPPGAVLALAHAAHDAVLALAELQKVVVAAVHGAVAGGGWGLTCAADLLLAGQSTRFVSAYPGIAVTPDCSMTWSLQRFVGQRRALEILLLNESIPAPKALEWGLVTAVYPDDTLLAEAGSMAKTLAASPAAAALGMTRSLVRSAADRSLAAHLDEEARSIAEHVGSPEAHRLIARFAQR